MANTYSKNFLSNVIFKINFPPIDSLAKEVSPGFKEKLSNDFPILEPVKMSNIKFEASPEEVKTEKDDRTMWRFKDKEDKTILELDVDSLAIVLKKYENFAKFEELILKVINPFLEDYKDVVINRLGLRYINEIQLEEKSLYEWDKYINSTLISNINFIDTKDALRRAMTFLEIAIDEETKLRLQYGIFNRTYPGKLVNKDFVLDYDCFTEIAFNMENLKDKIKTFNDIITEYFEKSIKEDFRKILNEK